MTALPPDDLVDQFAAPLASLPLVARIAKAEALAKISRPHVPLFKRRAITSAYRALAMCYRLESAIGSQGEHPDLRSERNKLRHHHRRRLRSALSAIPDLTLADLYPVPATSAPAITAPRSASAPRSQAPYRSKLDDKVQITDTTPTPCVEGEASKPAGRFETLRNGSGDGDTSPSPVKTGLAPRSRKPVSKKSRVFRNAKRNDEA